MEQSPPSHDHEDPDDHMDGRELLYTLGDSTHDGVRGTKEDDGTQARRQAIASSGSFTTALTTTIRECYRCLPRTRPVGDRLGLDDSATKAGPWRPESVWGGDDPGEGSAASGPAREAGLQGRGRGGGHAGDEDASLVGVPLAQKTIATTAVAEVAGAGSGHAADCGTSSAPTTVLLSSSGLADDNHGTYDAGSVSGADRGEGISAEGANQGGADGEGMRPFAWTPGAEFRAAAAASGSARRNKLPVVARALQVSSYFTGCDIAHPGGITPPKKCLLEILPSSSVIALGRALLFISQGS